ncbi:dedicator of cytokinesis protein myoblast city isoform X3 [Rhynchophorus ferrugineus]|uniref:dedicator of cytokinesis protein myoblast city isoform X3 n=1 Tax=Rhynchophorus ferrugineus TaxID=354439 RepID=UPI003FCD3254
MTGWNNVQDLESFGIAIYNFRDSDQGKLDLTVGDSVHILQEEANWYYGYVVGRQHVVGIFPKNYVHIKKCNRIDPMGPVFKDPPISQEITSVLREWGSHWKMLYVKHSKDFEQMKTNIYDLICLRSKIVSGTLPIDELRRVTKAAAEQIDLGNRILGLDMVVRDNNGNLINPETTSTLQMFYLHKAATERLNNKTKDAKKHFQPKTAIQQYSNIFLVAVKNFTCKMSEDAELLMSLYDAKEYRSITESYVVRWTKEGLMSDLDQMYNLRVMFTDLGKKDLEKEKIYLICYVVRVGLMDVKEVDHRRSSMGVTVKKNPYENMRRPCGVAAMEITNYINGKLDTDLDQEFPVPFVSCEKDTLEQTLRKIISKEKVENKNQALFVSMKLLRGDLKQVRDENPHLVLGNVSRARKMGFSEVILPGDVRNDLYLTLLNGEFTKGSKTSEKNVEVVVKVYNDKGQVIPQVISLGGGVQELDEYRSVIYYHEDKPQWFETFKIALRIEEFKSSHLKFTFKHRSTNEAKDKNEKPFAMCYVKLMQENGVTLPDAQHSLVVYKIDYKKFDEGSLDYLKLPCFVSEIKENQKQQIPGLSTSLKDSFNISINICSTKLTQNVKLLGLLNWASHKQTVAKSLEEFMLVDNNEVVKFLQDILDALFCILMDTPESSEYDIMVFECLLRIINLVTTDFQYLHFEPVLDVYVKESFSATLAYGKLISILKSVINKTVQSWNKEKLILQTMKGLQYIMRFIARSRILLLEVDPEASSDKFVDNMREFLHNVISLMSIENNDYLLDQGACLKYLPTIIPEILLVFDRCEFSYLLCDFLKQLPPNRLTKQKMMTINDVVHSKLFQYPECRHVLLPMITEQIKCLIEIKEEGVVQRQDGRRQNKSVAKVAQLLGTTKHLVTEHVGHTEEVKNVELCVKILSDIMELLFRKDVGSTYNDIARIIHSDLRTVIQSHIKVDKDDSPALSRQLVAVMLDIFRQMSSKHYNNYISDFQTPFDILDFLMEILVVFKELVSSSVFPKDWCDMLLLQNNIILKSLRLFANTIHDYFFDKFEHDAWSNFFHCAIAFMTQDVLQLEGFPLNKRTRIVNQYSDMRREMGFEIRSMWFNLGTHKVHFVPSLVGLILEMTLIPEPELRKVTIPMFFDMMQCEFYSSRLEEESFGDTKRNSSNTKANFDDFENEMIVKLDALFEGGRGDVEYKRLFYDIMIDLCEKHTSMKEEGVKFVRIVSQLMESLLEYRSILSDDNKENTMSCTVNLLDFYSEINKRDMYIRYLNKLVDLHIECENFTEAAFTLELHTKLLEWSDAPLPMVLKNLSCTPELKDLKTHRQFKTLLYDQIIENYSKGKMWEYAISKCKELAEQYEKETFDYEELSRLHSKLSDFYDNIMKSARPEPEYFRVGYFGKGFTKFLQNKMFIYRGKEYERLQEFNCRIMNEFPKAQLLNKLTPPGDDICNSDGQYIQINKVDPVMEEKKQRFSGKPVCEQIVKFYKVNNIRKFTYSRPFTRKDPFIKTDNEFAHLWLERTELVTTYPLPGILRWFPVCMEETKVKEISPLNNAIETIENKNTHLINYINCYNRDENMQINPLSLTLTGILDAAVMGGVRNYEEVFFSAEYLEHHPDDDLLVNKLKDLIASQVPLLNLCVEIHRRKAPSILQPLQKRLEERLEVFRNDVEIKYGRRDCDLKLENGVQMRRHFSTASDMRLSDVTITPDRSSLTTHSKSMRLSPSQSFTSTSSATHKKSHKLSTKRRRSKTEASPSPLLPGATQWYTSDDTINASTGSNSNVAGTPPIELREELHSKRPLRSEIEKEKRLSRPSSGQFSRLNSMSLQIRSTNSSGNSSNRNSAGTTDSSVSEEDLCPPPLPAKQKDINVDMASLTINENISFLHMRSSFRRSFQITEAVNTIKDVPPSPPPKPPKNRHGTFT